MGALRKVYEDPYETRLAEWVQVFPIHLDVKATCFLMTLFTTAIYSYNHELGTSQLTCRCGREVSQACPKEVPN